MPLLKFQDSKKNISFTLEVPSNSTFYDIFELVFKHFNLNKNDLPDEKSAKIKFIYKSVICKYERTPESYQIGPQDTITIYFPKLLNELIQKQSTPTSSTMVKPEVPAMNESTENSSTNINQITPEIQKSQNDTEKIVNQQISSPHEISSNSESKILNYVNPNLLKQLVDIEFNQVDAAYAIAYKKNINSAIDFLNLGLSSDPEVRSHIDHIVAAKQMSDNDEIIRHTLEVVKIEAKAKKENEKICVAAAIGVFAYHNQITDPSYTDELKEYIRQVEIEYPGQSIERLEELLQEENPNQKPNWEQFSNKTETPNYQSSEPQIIFPHNQQQINYPPNQAQIIFPPNSSQVLFPNMQMSYPSMQMNYPNMQMNYPNMQMSYPSMQMNYPNMQMNYPNMQINYPNTQMNYPNMQMNYPNMQMNYPNMQMNYPSMQMNYPNMQINYPNMQMNYPSMQMNYPNMQMSYQHGFGMPYMNDINSVKNKFWSIFDNIPQMTPQNYQNPFKETYNDLVKMCNFPNDEVFYSYGRTLNYEQLLFLYRNYKEKGINLSELVQLLKVVDGDIQTATTLVD